MSVKVKRGLGLLVIAVLALIGGGVASRLDPSGGAGEAVQAVLLIGCTVVMIGGFLAGLALLAWGLLVD